MAKLIYASTCHSTAGPRTNAGPPIGLRRTTTSSRSSPSSCGPQARTSTGGACTRRWLCGRTDASLAAQSDLMADYASAWQAGGGRGRLLLDPHRAAHREHHERAVEQARPAQRKLVSFTCSRAGQQEEARTETWRQCKWAKTSTGAADVLSCGVAPVSAATPSDLGTGCAGGNRSATRSPRARP